MEGAVELRRPRPRDELKSFLGFMLKELKPRGPLLTPFNLISLPIILLGLGILVIRFVFVFHQQHRITLLLLLLFLLRAVVVVVFFFISTAAARL